MKQLEGTLEVLENRWHNKILLTLITFYIKDWERTNFRLFISEVRLRFEQSILHTRFKTNQIMIYLLIQVETVGLNTVNKPNLSLQVSMSVYWVDKQDK